MRQRLAGWQLIGRLSKARTTAACATDGTSCENAAGVKTSPQALGPTSGQRAVLGRYALSSRATAIKPDDRYFVNVETKVKTLSDMLRLSVAMLLSTLKHSSNGRVTWHKGAELFQSRSP
jgi:hypothetical protein